MATRIKKDSKAEKEKLQTISFDTDDFVVIKLKSDGKEYVEHKVFAQKLIDRKLAEIVKDAKVEPVKSNTTILQND